MTLNDEERMTDEERAWAQETLAKRKQLKLWATFINHNYSAWAALFELITGFKPPKLKDLLPTLSGHH